MERSTIMYYNFEFPSISKRCKKSNVIVSVCAFNGHTIKPGFSGLNTLFPFLITRHKEKHHRHDSFPCTLK